MLRSSIDFTDLEEQCGDEPVTPFSYDTLNPGENKVKCHISWTNETTKQIILDNIHRSPMYSGKIEGIGPRYCPSLEDKIVRFADKKRHQLFIEPCGLDTEEMYLQGMSSSLPEDVQIKFYHSIKGLEHCVVMRPAYAIEYFCADPVQMNSTLEFKDYEGLYGAGQFNGSSGYEEAAAQGLVAGINAALKILNKKPLILDRASSYIGTLIDNADTRLTPIGREIGLINDERWERFQIKQEKLQKELERISKTTISPTDQVNSILKAHNTTEISTGVRLIDLLKRPELSYEILKEIDITRPELEPNILEQAEIEIKYEGYIKRQLIIIDQVRRLEKKLLPRDTDYSKIEGLRLEAREKLNKVRPENIGQASRISGVSPADISVLVIYLASLKNNRTVGSDDN